MSLAETSYINKSYHTILTATSKTWTRTWTRTLDPDPGLWNRTLDPDPEKSGINIGLKNMSDYRKLCFTKTIRNLSYCLKVRVLTDI